MINLEGSDTDSVDGLGLLDDKWGPDPLKCAADHTHNRHLGKTADRALRSHRNGY